MNVVTDLAGKAAGQPEPPGSGRYNYVHTLGWYTAAQARGAASREEAERRLWVAADGSGRIEETRDGRRAPMSGRYGPGELRPSPVLRLPLDPSVLAELGLALWNTPAGWARTIWDVWAGQAVSPALQAELLARLSAHRGLRTSDTTDAVGRPGLAVTAEGFDHPGGRTVRRSLVLDRETGMLLAAEESEVDGGGFPVNGRRPTAAVAWLSTGYTEDAETIP